MCVGVGGVPTQQLARLLGTYTPSVIERSGGAVVGTKGPWSWEASRGTDQDQSGCSRALSELTRVVSGNAGKRSENWRGPYEQGHSGITQGIWAKELRSSLHYAPQAVCPGMDPGVSPEGVLFPISTKVPYEVGNPGFDRLEKGGDAMEGGMGSQVPGKMSRSPSSRPAPPSLLCAAVSSQGALSSAAAFSPNTDLYWALPAYTARGPSKLWTMAPQAEGTALPLSQQPSVAGAEGEEGRDETVTV